MDAGDRIIPMDADAIREWRKNIPAGHSRKAYEFKGPGRGGVNRDNPVHDPDQTPSAMDPDRGFDLDPLPKGIEEPRRARDEAARRMIRWCRSAQGKEVFRRRAELLKATSPLQFSHIDQTSLEEQLAATVIAKTQAAVERVYSRRGWAKPQDFDLVRSGSPATDVKLLLPGQKGRPS